MSQDRPTERELRRGMTVRVVQEQENNAGEPLVGEIQTIVDSDDPRGVAVKLESGVTGRVTDVVTDAEEDEMLE